MTLPFVQRIFISTVTRYCLVATRCVGIPILTTTRYVTLKRVARRVRSHRDALLKQVLLTATRCGKRACPNNALQCDITMRATRFDLNRNALVWMATRCVRIPTLTTTRYVDIKTRCTQGNVTSRRVIEAGSPYRDALREESLPQ